MMRAFLVAALILAGGCTRSQECGALTVCAGGTRSFALCKADDQCYYVATGDQRFNCASCADCAAATTQVTSWCGGGGTTGGTTGGSTGGTTGTTVESCQAGTCARGTRSYQFCTTGTQCRYLTSDGQVFTCSGCECSAAANAVSMWCSAGGTTSGGTTTGGTTTGGTTTGGTTTGGTTGGTTCAGGTADQCGSCCTNLHPAGFKYAQMTVFPCICSECNADCAGSQVCGSAGTTSSACATCGQNVIFSACQTEVGQCINDTECQAFLLCVQNCTN